MRLWMLGCLMGLSGLIHAQTMAVTPEVKAEEDIYTFTQPNNGSGPLWSYGCTVVGRDGEDVYATQMETGADVPKLCNTRWRFLKRAGAATWNLIAEADGYHQREPVPMAVLPGGQIYLNVNDSTQPPGTQYGPCEPALLRFQSPQPPATPARILPQWHGPCNFTDHSYRGFAADRATNQLLMFNIDAKTSVQHWCWMSADGATLGMGEVTFPIRSCYPQAALTKGAGYLLAISDIVEPIEAWKTFKFEKTQQTWDYVFRILHFTWTPDIAKEPFRTPIEIANVDATGGYIANHDLWIAPDGAAYILYAQREVQSDLLRDQFFPGKSILDSLNLAVVRDGQVVERRVLIPASDACSPGCARFHETANGTVYAVAYASAQAPGNILMQVYPPVDNPPRIPIPFKIPFGSFCTASARAGNAPSNTLDLLGFHGKSDVISYGQVALNPVAQPPAGTTP